MKNREKGSAFHNWLLNNRAAQIAEYEARFTDCLEPSHSVWDEDFKIWKKEERKRVKEETLAIEKAAAEAEWLKSIENWDQRLIEALLVVIEGDRFEVSRFPSHLVFTDTSDGDDFFVNFKPTTNQDVWAMTRFENAVKAWRAEIAEAKRMIEVRNTAFNKIKSVLNEEERKAIGL